MRVSINIHKKSIFFFLILAFLPACSTFQTTKVTHLYDVKWQDKTLSSDKNVNNLIVDIVLLHVEGSIISWENLKSQFIVAQKTLSKHGVTLNLKHAARIKVPQSWHKIYIDKLTGIQNDELGFYQSLEAKRKKLSKRANKIFNKMIESFENKEKTIFLITMNDIYMGIFEKSTISSEFEVKNFKVGGYSFPAYIYQDRIDKNLKGIITLGRESKTNSMIAHELAHKLINATHEGGASCPKFSGKKIPGILGYTGSVEILKGQKGRWHSERLKLTPFAYRLINGKKVWNQKYQKHGVYSDPIYGKYVISPVCPN